MPDTSNDGSVPFMQRLYDRIWLLATLALVFFLLSYVVWGLIDVYTITGG